MGPMEIVLIVLIGVMIIAYPIMSYFKNKKDRQKMQEMTNSFKRGDKVLTASGVYGTIIDLHRDGEKTIVTIETGSGAHKGYISLDALAIYQVLENATEPVQAKQEEAKTESQEEVKTEEEKPAQAEEKPKAKKSKKKEEA